MSDNMVHDETLDNVEGTLTSDPTPDRNPNLIVKEYLLENIAVFRELTELKRRGWENPQGDDHFKSQRSRADNPNDAAKCIFYNMMTQIGDELHNATSALQPVSATDGYLNVLDLCMAPGGFTASVLKLNDNARVCGISLPPSQGGHEIRLPGWKTDTRIQLSFLDITMLATEMDVTNIPADHPDAKNFLSERPFSDKTFDLIFCDGQVLRMHSRAEYREPREAWRLLTSQLVLALQRVKRDGTIVALLHKLDAWDTVELLHTLRKFSSLQLFKPKRKHAIKSSFYVVVECIQSESPCFLAAVASWKQEWNIATFGNDAEYKASHVRTEDDVEKVLLEFGTELIKLGGPIWEIQSVALQKAPFVK